MKEKFIVKYMHIAKLTGEMSNPCHSRKIGAVIIDPVSYKILGTGYNGPPPGTPHPTSVDYLGNYFWPQLTANDKEYIRNLLNVSYTVDSNLKQYFIDTYMDKEICPRRLVNAKSGQRNELCSCGHAERHAITNASCDLHGKVMLCWCGVPCLQCTDSIIQSGIKKVYCYYERPMYHDLSLWLFIKAGVSVYELDKEELLAERVYYKEVHGEVD